MSNLVIDCELIKGNVYVKLLDFKEAILQGKSESEPEWAPAFDVILETLKALEEGMKK